MQFSGVIYNKDSGTVVPFVTITNGNSIYSANYQGYFSFVAHERDTIVFSSVGYNREALVIPVNSPENKYTVLVRLKQEIINLPVVRVYPWASPEEFKKEFMAMKLADDDLEIAKKNVSKERIFASAANLPRDGIEMQGINFQNNHTSLTNKNINQRLANPLLNPFAWGSLIQQIIQGDKSRGNE